MDGETTRDAASDCDAHAANRDVIPGRKNLQAAVPGVTIDGPQVGGRGRSANRGPVVYTKGMPTWKENRTKPVIGLAGGIGSGKSLVGRQFGSLGCLIVDADKLAHEVLQTPEVKNELRAWMGDGIFDPDGSVNRIAVAAKVFSDPGEAQRLNRLIHPKVALRREALTAAAMADHAVRAIIWDTPLLFETGLEARCDAVVFVNVPRELRLNRLIGSRHWTAEELNKREKLQISLDKKAELADYCIDNSGDEASTLRQVKQVLSQILTSPM